MPQLNLYFKTVITSMLPSLSNPWRNKEAKDIKVLTLITVILNNLKSGCCKERTDDKQFNFAVWRTAPRKERKRKIAWVDLILRFLYFSISGKS